MQAGLATDHWKRTLEDYVMSARHMLKSMHVMGFVASHPVPVDPDGELLDGAHRVACALALEIAYVPVTHETRKVWAPAWDRAWFERAGMSGDALQRACADLERLAA